MKAELKYILPDHQQQIIDGLYALITRITKAFIINNISINSDKYRELVTPHFIRIAEIQIEFQRAIIEINYNNQKQLI